MPGRAKKTPGIFSAKRPEGSGGEKDTGSLFRGAGSEAPRGAGRLGRLRRRWVITAGAWLLLAGLALALYAGALGNPYISDDKKIVGQNPTFSSPSLAGLARIWVSDYWAEIEPDGRVIPWGPDRNLYRPVTIFTFWLNACLGGMDPWRVRLVNVLLHATAALAVGLCVRRWTGPAGGAAAAILVLAHPVATETINRLVGRADILALVGVAGFLAVQRGAQLEGWTWRRTVLAALLAAVAIGAKEAGLVLVPLALVQAWLGRAAATPKPHADAPAETMAGGAADAAGRGGRARPTMRATWRGGLALLVPLALYFAGRFATVGWPRYRPSPGYDLLDNPLVRVGFLERLPAALSLAWYYARMLVAPWPLVAFDTPTHLPGWADASVWAGLAALLGMAAALAWLAARRRERAVTIAAAWWLASYALVGQLLVAIGTYREVRLVYPMLGVLGLAAGAGLQALASRRRWGRVAAVALLATAAAAGSWMVVRRHAEFRSEVALLEADLRHRPHSAGTYLRLGGVYMEANRMTEATWAKNKAVQLAPQSSQAWYDRGASYAAESDFVNAARCFRRSCDLDPTNHLSVMALGVVLMTEGDLDVAEELLRKAERLAPPSDRLGLVLWNLAVMDIQRERWDQAAERLRKMLEANPRQEAVRQKLEEVERRRREQKGPATPRAPSPRAAD